MIFNPDIEWQASLSYKVGGADKTIPITSVADVEKLVSADWFGFLLVFFPLLTHIEGVSHVQKYTNEF